MSWAFKETFKCPKNCAKLPKRTRGTRCVFAFSDCGFGTNKREERTFSAEIDHDGIDHAIRYLAGGDPRHHRRRDGISPGFVNRASASGGALLQSRRGQFLEEL